MKEYANDAINSVLAGRQGICKFLSATDTNAASSNQAGILLKKSAETLLFSASEIAQAGNLKKTVKIHWQDGAVTESSFSYYRNFAQESKKEIRLTRFGKGFPFLTAEYTGALFVLTRQSQDEYRGFFLNTDDEIEDFLNAFGISPAETDGIIGTEMLEPETVKNMAFQEFLSNLTTDFPESELMSATAREIENRIYNHAEYIITNPDQKIINWTNMEYSLFRALEHLRYGELIRTGFGSVEEFVRVANMVINRRKSRAGKSLENHLAAIFDSNQIRYEKQVVTEGRKKPDFLFPSQNAYRDPNFSVNNLVTLAAKTTCKDRWRQVLNEADRLKNSTKYLFTLQRGISGTQMDEMQAEKLVLVVPEPYIREYPEDRRNRIWTLAKFVDHIKMMEAI